MKHTADLVIEWSPRETVAYDGRTQSTTSDLSLFQGRTAVLALGRRAVFVKHIRLPNSSREDMSQVLRMRLPELFPVGGSELAFDFQAYEDVTEQGRLCLVAAARTEDLKAVQSLMESQRINVVQVLPVAVASPAVASQQGLARAAIVQPVAEGFAVDIVDEGKLMLSRIVSERDELDTDICVAFSLAGIPCSPVIVAGGLLLADAEKSSKVDPRQNLLSEPSALNLELPEIVAKRKAQQKQGKVRQATFLCVAAIALSALLYNDYDESTAKSRADESKVESRLKRATTLQKAVQVDLTRYADGESILARAFSPAQKLSDVVTLAAAKVPKGIWLTGVSVERGKDLQIRGISKTSQLVTTYVDALAAESRFRNVRLVFANDSTIDEEKVTQFSISAFPVGNLPLMDTGKKGGK